MTPIYLLSAATPYIPDFDPLFIITTLAALSSSSVARAHKVITLIVVMGWFVPIIHSTDKGLP